MKIDEIDTNYETEKTEHIGTIDPLQVRLTSNMIK